jgi:hypothetical protein
MVDRADMRLVARHVRANEELHGLNAVIGDDTGHRPRTFTGMPAAIVIGPSADKRSNVSGDGKGQHPKDRLVRFRSWLPADGRAHAHRSP